jgi:hypothetical protein
MYIGLNLEFLCNVTARTPIYPSRTNPLGIADRLRMLRQDLAELELSEAERVLSADLDEVLKCIEEDHHVDVLGRNARKIRQIARNVRNVLSEEGSRRRVFVTLRDRTDQIIDLLRDPIYFFGVDPEILELTDVSKDDFYEAARCYSVGFSVASMMFMLRATEEVLRTYYSQVTHQQAQRRNWGALSEVLRIPVLNCPSELMQLLEELQRRRNIAMYPGRRRQDEWDMSTAKHILDACHQAFQLMINDLKARPAVAHIQ